MGGGDQLAALRCVDAVEARRDRRRAADADVNLGGASGTHHLDDLAAGRAAHNRVVDEHHALTLEQAAHRVQFHLHTEVADRLCRLDEGAADVVVADEPHSHRHARLLGVADGSADARVGNRHDHVGGNGGLAGQLTAEAGAHVADAAPEHLAVGAREVDVLEDAVGARRRRERPHRARAVGPDDQHLAGLDVADVGGAHQVHRAGLGTHDPAVAEPAQRQRPEPVRVADGDQSFLGDEGEREGAGELGDRLDQRVVDAERLGAGIEVQRHFSVAVGLEDRALAHQLVAQFAGVDDVAVVADADLAVHAVDEQRLGVGHRALAGGRVAGVADGNGARQRRQRVLGEDLGDVAHRAEGPHLHAVRHGDTRAFLAAVLQRVEPEVGHVGRLGVAVDTEDAAFFTELVEHRASPRWKSTGSTALAATPRRRHAGSSVRWRPPTGLRRLSPASAPPSLRRSRDECRRRRCGR
jgi:hypothetical protein